VKIRLVFPFVVILAVLLALTVAPSLAQEPDDEEQCWACHRQPNLDTVAGVQAANALCLDCHEEPDVSKDLQGQVVRLQVEEVAYATTRHGHVACVQCHSTVAHSPHQEEAPLACADCHQNLSAHIAAGDAHLTVECSACHFETEAVTRDPESGVVQMAALDAQGEALDRTAHQMTKPVDCARCHYAGNDVGAASAALPPKGLLCFACHDASPVLYAGHLGTAGSGVRMDWVSAPALLAFCIGLALASSVWLRGTVHGRTDLTLGEKLSYIAGDVCGIVFSRKVFTLLKHLVLDGILLRRTLKESVSRWFMHGLILWPFLGRCLLGVFTWCMAQFWPTAPLTQTLVNKNAAPVAFLYDFLALLVVVGAILALVRRAFDSQMREISTGGDVAITALLGGIFAFGFIVEGARLIVTQVPAEQAIYSFGGCAVSLLLRLLPLDWASFYAYLWWVHAALVAAFVAYLPFSKFFHILVGPMLVTIRGLSTDEE
jgi:nitrate reductase gamma subunit